MKRLILTSLLAVFTVSGALAQQLTVTIPGGHDREWYEHHGYQWHDGQWYRGEERERQKVGGQAALRSGSCVCGCDLNFGYQRRNRLSKSSLSTFVLVCNKRWAPRSVHCICCFLTNRLLTTWLIVDSTNAVLIVSPCRRRSPKFGMNSRLLQMVVLKSSRRSRTFFAAFERAPIK